MKTLTTIKAWILVCSLSVVSRASTDHSSSLHDASHHGGSIPQKTPHNTIVPFGIQIPEHVLSTQDVACISADSNIFEIMNKAQETCNGTDMRCTFYHFLNHGYQNIGTLDIDKELFDDLLMKFDNWLLTAEDIDTHDVPLEAKTKEDSVLDTASINTNGGHSNEEPIKNSTNISETERLYTNQSVHIEKVDNNTNESDADKVVNAHNIKNLYDTHHRNHHHRWKNGNHIKLVPEYNNEHAYFEVFLPKDQETGKPRTIYVEVDKEKNEFILLDEEIDKKLNGTKPIRIELDELSEIADTAFNNIAKSADHKEHSKSNLYDYEISGLNTNSALHEDERHLDLDVVDCTQNILNVSYPHICNINANQQLIPDNTTGFSRKIINFSKNIVVPNKYINQAQFYLESQIDNTTDVIPPDDLELLEISNNGTDIYQTGFNEETPLDTIEFYENNANIDLGLDNIECSPENVDILCDHNSTENYEVSTENDNITFYDDSFINLEQNKDTSIDIDFNDTYDFSSSETIHLNENLLQAEKPVQINNPKSTPNIYTEPELTSSLTAGISDYISSQLDAIPSENRQAHIDHSLESDVLPTYTTVPLLGKDLAKLLEADRHLQSSFPVYATLDLPAGASQNSSLNYDFKHPSVSSYNSPLDSNFGHESSRPKKVQSTLPIFPSPPVECIAQLNKDSKYSPFNFGFSWLPSYSRVEELRLPYAVGPLQKEPILQVPVQKNKQLSDSIYTEPTSSDHTIPIEDPRLCQTEPSLSADIQKPYHLEANALMSPKNELPSNLDLPKSSSDLDRISTPYQLSEPPLSVMPISLKDPANSPCPTQQISPYLHPTKSNQDLGFIKYSPFDNYSKEIMNPCAANQYRFPYTTIPYLINPYIQPPQFITPYLEPILPVAPLQSASKVLSLDPLRLSSDQSYPCLEEDYSKANKPIPLVPLTPNTPFLPLNPLLLGPGFVPNTLPYQNVWNNIPTLPCTMLLDQNIRNYPPIVNNHLTPGAQQNKILKPSLSASVPLSVFEHSCPIKNILEMKPSSYTPFLTPVQMDLNPSLALERDLQSLSLKYGIPLTKILNSLETEISDIQSKTSSSALEVPYSNLVHDSSLKTKPNATLDDDNRSGYEESLFEAELSNLVPLDSSLIGPHLEIESSLMLEANDSKNNTVVSETPIPTLLSGFEKQTTKLEHDSSLIGLQLPTSSLSHFDENRNANEVVISESDYSNLKPLDSSLIGPHLEIRSPPIVLDSNNSQGDIFTSHTKVPSQIEPQLNFNHPTHLVLDSSLIGSHLPSLSTVKPLLSDEIQNINDLIPLGSDMTDLTPLDLSVIHTQEDLVNQLDQTEIFKHENTAVTLLQPAAIPSTKLPPKYLPKTLMEEKLLLQSDSLIPLDSSLIGPELKLGSSPIIMDSLEYKTVPLVSKKGLQNTDNKLEELESIFLPSSLLTTLLKKPVEADSNLDIITQETKTNKELKKLSTDTNIEIPLTDISQTYKETDFKNVGPILELTSLTDDRNIPLIAKDSRTLKNKSDSLDTTHFVDYGSILDHSLTGTSILYKLENPEISTSVDSSIHLDNSLVGPSILQEIDSRAPTTINQNKKPSEILAAIDSLIKLESSFKGPTLHHEINSKETPSAFESVTQFENSLVPSLHETKEFSAMASVLNSSQLDSSLIGPSLHREKVFDSKDILDGSLVGPHLLTAVPFSGEEIQMINEELEPKLDLINLIPLDSSLTSPHIDFESELEQSEISRYQNPEFIKTSASNSEVSETRDFVPSNSLDEEMTPLEPIIVPSLCTSDHQELLSKFTNAVTKTQLSPSDLKPCDKLLSSIAKISSDNDVLQCSKDMQTLTLNTLLNTPISLQDELASEFSPKIMTSPAQDFLPVEYIKGLDSNNARTPKLLAESLPYTQHVPHITPMPYFPFLQMKPLTDRNWLGLNNIQNILQTSPSFRPIVGNAPIPFISNASPITSEYLKSILDLPSYSKLYPQLSIPDVYTPEDAIALASSECTKPSNNLLKNNFSLLPTNLESTVSKSEYKPIVVDDIMSLLDENSLQLLKDMSILPFRESFLLPTTPFLENGEIVSPSLLETVPILDSGLIQTRPLLPIPISNPLVSSPTHSPQICLYNTQNVPFMTHAPDISPCSIQPYSTTLFHLPLHSEYSEIIGPAPKIASLPTEYPKEFLQELLSKPCVESPIILPSSSLDTMLQLPTASNELNSGPCQLPPEYFTPISPIYTNPLTNAFTSPILPIYASPLSLFYAQSSSTPSTSLVLNVPQRESPLRPVALPINPYTARQLTPKYSGPVVSDYPRPLTVAHNIPVPLEIPYMLSQTHSSSYLPVHPSTIPIDTSAGSPIIESKVPPVMKSPISPPLSIPYFSPLPKSITSLGSPAYSSPSAPIVLETLAPTRTSPLVPSYLSLTNSYPSLPEPINAQTRPSNILMPGYLTPVSPVSSSLSSYNTPLSLNPISSPNPQIKPESQTLRLLNTLPIPNAVNPFLNIKQRLPNNPNILPKQSYATHVPTPNYNTQIKQNIPCEDALESNLLTSALTEELPVYDVIEENAYTYSNDKDDKYYEDPTLKYPLESLSYTLAPEEITEYLPSEAYIKLEDLNPSTPVNNCASRPSLQRTLHPYHGLAPYIPLHSNPGLKPRLSPPLVETIPQNIYDNTPLVSASSPLKHAVSLPTSILSSPLLKPLSPLTIAPINTLQAQYDSLSLAPMYTSLPLETAPKQLITKPSISQHSPSSIPVYDSQIHSSPLGKNPFLNPNCKPITEIASYPVPKNIVTSSMLAPSESILLSNLRHINISPESQNSCSAPITYSTPFISSSLLKPSAKRLPQNSGLYRHHVYGNSQYVSQSPMNNTLLQKGSLVQPLLAISQNNATLVPKHFSNTFAAFPEGVPIESVPSVTSPGIALSNYLPYDSSDHKYSGPCVSEISELEAPINPSTTTPYIFSKPPLDKYFKSPVSTQTNMPLYSIDDILELSPELLTNANIVNTVMPIEVSGMSASQSSPLSLDSLDTETIEEIEPNELKADLKNRFSPILGFNKQGQSHPAYASKYLATPPPTITMSSSKYKTTIPRPSYSIPSLISEEAELTHIKDLITLSQIKSESLIDDYSPSERKAPNSPTNIQEPDIVQLSPYTSLLNEFPPTTYKQMPANIQTPRYINQIQQPSPTYLSPQVCKELIQGLSTSQSPSTHIPQLTPSVLTGELSPQAPLYTSCMSIKPENWLESPIFVKSLPLQEKFLKVTPEKENIPPLHNKYRIANKITPQGNKYAYEPKSTISEIISELDSINPLLISKEPYVEYIDDLKPNKNNYYDPKSDNVSLGESKPDVFEAKPTKNLPEVSKGLSIPNYIRMVQRPLKLSKLDHFYVNNHIGKGPQVFNIPTSPLDSPADVASPYTITSPGVLKDYTVIPTKHFVSIPKLETASPSASESYTERPDSPENVPITNSYPQYYLNPSLKYSSQTKSPFNTIEIAETSEITPTSYNIDDIKYSGYKTYHIPSFKSPLSLQNLRASTRINSPSLVPYSSPIPAGKPSNVQATPSLLYCNLYSPPVIYEPPIPQYHTPIKTKLLQTKLGLEPSQESPQLNEYNPEEDIPASVDSMHEDNELKTSLINYIIKREDFKNNNAEVTIPIGNIAITRKEPYNANTVETNNPSIGLKVWKSNVKIAQAELKLKFKDLSVNNFMPIVNNLDKYDMEEIRKIVKSYIDEKYGNHIEINNPYTVDNKYTVIKDFDPNGVDTKYNLLWPTNYV